MKPPEPVAPPVPPKPPAVRGSLSGRITDSVTNLPLVNVEVIAQLAGTPRELASTFTQADGTYRFTDLPFDQAILVSTQPVHGAVVYAHEASAPLRLVRGAAPPVLDLACAHTFGSGNLEVCWGSHATRPRSVCLIHEKDLGGGLKRMVLAKRFTVPGGASVNTFHHLAPGAYTVVLGPIFSLSGRPQPGQPATIKAGETTRVTPLPNSDPASHHAQDPPKVVHFPF